MIKAIIFDFDGVILESAIIKTEAFGEVVAAYPPKQRDAFVAYHMSHMGISRHVKFRYFIEEILGETYSETKEKELADSFERIVFDRVMNCSFVPGAKKFLERNYKNFDFYIASGTPIDEMNQIVSGRGLDKYFKEVYGSPLKKNDIIDLVLDKHGYSRDEVVFVGDAITDLKAAQTGGLQFIGRSTDDNEVDFAGVSYKVTDLLQIEDIIKEL